jgi:PASTA domain
VAVDRGRADVVVPAFVGMQALNAWLAGHEAGLLLQGPDPDSPDPVLHGVVIAQRPGPGELVRRWDPVTVWVRPHEPGAGVREPRRPSPDPLEAAAERAVAAVIDDPRALLATSPARAPPVPGTGSYAGLLKVVGQREVAHEHIGS